VKIIAFCIGVTWGEGANALPPTFFLPKFSFFGASELKRDKLKKYIGVRMQEKKRMHIKFW